jgi:hypothetical protein
MDRYNQAHKIAPAVSLSADGGHGEHCYVDGVLTCGWPEQHRVRAEETCCKARRLEAGYEMGYGASCSKEWRA